jgi:hypothetical protein
VKGLIEADEKEPVTNGGLKEEYMLCHCETEEKQ